MGKKIALVSRRKHIIEFFTLEAKLMCGNMAVFPAFCDDINNFDVVICDGIEPPKIYDSIVYKLCEDESNADFDLRFPIPLEELRNIFVGETGSNTKENSQNIIFMKEDSREVIYKNQYFTLTEYECRLLLKLSEKKLPDGEFSPVSRKELMETFGAEKGNIADVYVSKLRKKLENPSGPRIISTVRGNGYKLSVEIEKYT